MVINARKIVKHKILGNRLVVVLDINLYRLKIVSRASTPKAQLKHPPTVHESRKRPESSIEQAFRQKPDTVNHKETGALKHQKKLDIRYGLPKQEAN